MRASIFITCYNDTLYPETGRAVVKLLEKLGVELEFHPKQTCCGQMHANTGFRGEAFSQAKRFIRLYQDTETVVVPSSSCVAMIRDHYPKMADKSGDAALRRAVKNMLPRIYEFTELLVDKLGVTDVGAFFPHAVALHPSCHSLRSLHLGDRPARLLNGVRGLTLVDLPEAEECCGFGGTFAIKNAEVSLAMLSDKIRCILNSGAEVCAAVDNSCLMHIGGALSRQRAGVRVLHLAEILASRDSKGVSA